MVYGAMLCNPETDIIIRKLAEHEYNVIIPKPRPYTDVIEGILSQSQMMLDCLKDNPEIQGKALFTLLDAIEGFAARNGLEDMRDKRIRELESEIVLRNIFIGMVLKEDDDGQGPDNE